MTQTLTLAPRDAEAGRIPSFDLPDRLRKARVTAGLEQIELAELTGLSKASISSAENGHATPRRATLTLWAAATGVDLEWLKGGVTSRNSVDA